MNQNDFGIIRAVRVLNKEMQKEAENDNFQYFLIWSKKIYEVRKPQYIAIERNRENEIAYVCGFYGKMR